MIDDKKVVWIVLNSNTRVVVPETSMLTINLILFSYRMFYLYAIYTACVGFVFYLYCLCRICLLFILPV